MDVRTSERTSERVTNFSQVRRFGYDHAIVRGLNGDLGDWKKRERDETGQNDEEGIPHPPSPQYYYFRELQ